MIVDGDYEAIDKKKSLELKKELNDLQYPAIFESVLDLIISGEDIRYHLLSRNISVSKFMSWVFNNSERKQRWVDAKLLLAELLELEIITLSDDTKNVFNPNELVSAKIRIDTRFKLLESLKPKNAKGDKNTNITDQLKLAQKRIDEFSIKQKPKTKVEDFV